MSQKFNNFAKKKCNFKIKFYAGWFKKVNNMPRKTKLTSLGVVHKLL